MLFLIEFLFTSSSGQLLRRNVSFAKLTAGSVREEHLFRARNYSNPALLLSLKQFSIRATNFIMTLLVGSVKMVFFINVEIYDQILLPERCHSYEYVNVNPLTALTLRWLGSLPTAGWKLTAFITPNMTFQSSRWLDFQEKCDVTFLPFAENEFFVFYRPFIVVKLKRNLLYFQLTNFNAWVRRKRCMSE